MEWIQQQLRNRMEFKSIIKESDLRKIAKETIDEFADTVTSTLGPYGSTVILCNAYDEPIITKDGVTVSKNIAFDNPIKNSFAKIIKEVAKKTLKEAGDGTTTAICLAQAIINEGLRRMTRGASYLEILDELNKLESEVIKHLNEMSEKLKPEDIIDVATISSNGNMEMGTIIEKAFKHSHIVKIEEGTATYDEVDTISGMVLDTGYLDASLVTNKEKDTIEYKNVKVLIIHGHLTNLKDIGVFLEKEDGPFLIIADAVAGHIKGLIRSNYNSGALAIGLMKSPGFGGHRKNLIDDIEAFIGYNNVTRYRNTKDIRWGILDSIVIGRDSSVLTKNQPTPQALDRIRTLKGLRKVRKDERSLDLLEIRIENLNASLALIKVGGTSTIEVKEKLYRYDDSVRAVGCALEEGIVPGGGKALNEIYYRLKETNLNPSSFLDILNAPMLKIEKNSNYKLNIENTDMLEAKIYDPTKVTKIAFRNALSVARILLNTSNIVLDSSLWK